MKEGVVGLKPTWPALLALTLVLTSAGCAPRTATPAPAPAVAASTAPNATTAAATSTAAATGTPDATMTFAVIGDYGWGGANEAAVAKLVASWDPDFVIATGDDYYNHAGGTGTAKYDNSTGRYYCRWLKDVSTTGTPCRIGQATLNAFFPALGNHDYTDATPSIRTYLTYFKLPGTGFTNTSGNERYYDFVEGPIHFFVLNSNSAREPAGTSRTSVQAKWLKKQLAASTSRWNIVYDHHPPYSSDRNHGSILYMQWPFAAWGADAVISGHAHTYERLTHDRIPYFVNGLGGSPRHTFRAHPLSGSRARYRANWGAQKVTVTGTNMEFRFYTVTGALKDTLRLTAAP